MTEKKSALDRAEEIKRQDQWRQPGTAKPEKRPGPFAQDRSRTPPTKEQRERDYRGKTSQS